MSTLFLSPEHLSAVTYALTRYRVIAKNSLQNELNAVMAELLEHNIDEYNQRYPKYTKKVEEYIPFYTYRQPTKKVQDYSAIAIHKLARCYQYNSSQSKDWDGSRAERWIESLLYETIASLPEYKSAEWDI